MNSTNASEAAQLPETPTVEPRPAPQETAETERLVHPGAKLGWTDSGGMVEQQASAMEWVRASGEARAAEGERAAAKQERSAAAEMTDSRQEVRYSRWTGEPLGEAAGQAQSGGISQSH